MPIVVEHQPSFKTVGRAAYGAGAGQYMTRLREQKAAERLRRDQLAAQERNANAQLQSQYEREKLQQQGYTDRFKAKELFDLQEKALKEQWDVEQWQREQAAKGEADREKMERERQAAEETRRWQVATDPKLQAALGQLNQDITAVWNDDTITDDQRGMALDQVKNNPLYQYLPLYRDMYREKTIDEEWGQSHVVMDDGRIAYKSGPDRWSIGMPPKAEAPKEPPAAEPLSLGDQMKIQKEAQEWAERRFATMYGDPAEWNEDSPGAMPKAEAFKYINALTKRREQQLTENYYKQFEQPGEQPPQGPDSGQPPLKAPGQVQVPQELADFYWELDAEDRTAVQQALSQGYQPGEIRAMINEILKERME